MNRALNSRLVRLLGICAVALLAACFALFAFNLMTPARSLSEIQATRQPTRRPPPTITPVVYPATPPAFLQDDFTTRDNFPRALGDKLAFGYVNQGYHLAPPANLEFIRVLLQDFPSNLYRDLSLNVAAAPAPGSAPVEYGVLFWHGQDEAGHERFLTFTISSESNFRLRAYQPVENANGASGAYEWTDIVPSTSSTAIHLDGTPNNLRVDVHPRRLLAYINDALVIDTDNPVIGEWRSTHEFDGQVGMVALPLGKPGANALFTQFDVFVDLKQP